MNENYIEIRLSPLADDYEIENFKKIILEQVKSNETSYKNVLQIYRKDFISFIEKFKENKLIDWKLLSKHSNGWDENIIMIGKDVWNWTWIQLCNLDSPLFYDFQFIEAFAEYLDWQLISCDKRIDWNVDRIRQFQDKLYFSRIYPRWLSLSEIDLDEKVYRYSMRMCLFGISASTRLSIQAIENYKHLFDWEMISSNIAFKPSIDRIIKYIDYIKPNTLCFNSDLDLTTLIYLKDVYVSNSRGIFDKWNIETKKKYKYKPWYFSWKSAFENTKENWIIETIQHFTELLDYTEDENTWKYTGGEYPWAGISKNITDKNAILKFQDKIDFISLFQNHKCNCDTEIIEILVNKTISLDTQPYKQYLSSILKSIKIQKETIIILKKFWNRKYRSSYWHRNSDGSEEIVYYVNYWHLFKNLNNNIIWDEELEKIMVDTPMNYNVYDIISNNKIGNKCMILATPKHPWLKEHDLFSIEKIFPERDYIVIVLKKELQGIIYYLRKIDVFEHEIEAFKNGTSDLPLDRPFTC